MAKLTTERLSADIQLLHEFRAHLQQFQVHRENLQRLKEKVEGNWMMGMDLNAADKMQRDLVSQLMAERQEIGRRLHDVTEITGRYPLRTELIILPPRLIGGYSSKMNLFEAFIQLQLPHDFVVDPISVYDVVDQAIWACERQLKESVTLRPPDKPKPQHQSEVIASSIQEVTRPQNRAGGWTWITVFTVITGFATLIGLIALCPKPAIDRDITLDERNPFEMQFRVHNSSPWFDLYEVMPACELLKVEIGSVILPKGTLVWPNVPPTQLPAGGSTTFPCHLSPEFKADSQEAYKSADVVLTVRYRWFRRFIGSVNQRVVLAHEKSGRPIWLFMGTKD